MAERRSPNTSVPSDIPVPAATSRKRSAKPASGRKRGAKPAKKAPAKTRPMWLRVVRVASLVLSICIAAVFITTAYAGYMSPLRHGGAWGILPLCFPLVFWGTLLFLVAQLFYCRKGSLVLFVGMLASAGPVLTYFPVHFGSPKVPAGADTISVLTYNLANLEDQRGASADTTQSTMLNYILGQNADIVCLQEATYFSSRPKSYRTFVQPWQIDSLHSRYKYIHHDGHEMMVLSKFPLTPIHLDITRDKFKNGNMAAYRVELPDGRGLTVFSVHLQSLALGQEDKQLYHSLTELHQEDLSDVKSQLLKKLSYANIERARQAHFILRYARLYGGPDAIITGDFNDVPGCFTIRALEDAGFKSVYPSIGFGPMVTYNQNRFLFCIDHMLYRGDLIPLSLRKGTLKASDHYPLTVRFAVPSRNSAPGPLD